MRKFKVGDRVKIVELRCKDVGDNYYKMLHNISEIVGVDNRYYQVRCVTDSADYWWFLDYELELVDDVVVDDTPKVSDEFTFHHVIASLKEGQVAVRVSDGNIIYRKGERLYWDVDGRTCDEYYQVTCHDKNVKAKYVIKDDPYIEEGVWIELDVADRSKLTARMDDNGKMVSVLTVIVPNHMIKRRDKNVEVSFNSVRNIEHNTGSVDVSPTFTKA